VVGGKRGPTLLGSLDEAFYSVWLDIMQRGEDVCEVHVLHVGTCILIHSTTKL